MTIKPNAGNRADLRFDGSVLKLAAGIGDVPPSAANGIAVTIEGKVGIGTGVPFSKLAVENSDGSAVYANAIGAGAGVIAKSDTGYALEARGNATQSRDKGGFVKAMAYIHPLLPANQAVVRCFNSQETGIPASTVPCGFTFTKLSAGNYHIDFGFKVDDRFISVTPLLGGVSIAAGPVPSAPTQIYVNIYAFPNPVEDPQPVDLDFYVFVF